MNKKLHKSVLISGVLVTLSFLPGCALTDMFQSNSADTAAESQSEVNQQEVMTGETLVTIKGRPAITTDTLKKAQKQLFKSDPRFEQALKYMDPKEFERNLLEGLIGQAIADEYVVANKIDQTKEYKAELQNTQKVMRQMLNARFFNEQVSVAVSDSEARSFYEANKNKMQGYMISQGGVTAQGIEFANLADAKAFVAKAKMLQNNFQKTAQENNLAAKIKDFKIVNAQSIGMDQELRDKVVATKNVPSIEVVEAGGKFWVVYASSKEEPKYMPYDQIKDDLKQRLEQNKRVEQLEKKINELRKEYDVMINEDYFGAPKEAPSAPLTGGLAKGTDAQEVISKRLV